ncbi:hypothetical protein QZH41_002780 [Actinostola sp. cb2023]|nr:hypothetical protein QZH41_002780 [Actinostola sp. cb2023]
MWNEGTNTVRVLAAAQHNYVDSEDEDYALALEGDGSQNEDFPRKLYAHLAIENSIIKFQLDCGATVNILPSDLYIDIFGDHEYKLLKKHDTKLLMFNKTELNTIGTISVVTANPKNGQQYKIEFVITEKGLKPLLGAPTIQHLKLMSVNKENVMSVDIKSHNNGLTVEDVIAQYKDVFTGEGKLQEELHLEVDRNVPLVKLPVRKIPVALKEPVKDEIDRLVKMGILTKVEVPTDWISAMVATKKRNGKIRLCIDPKPLNQALKRNHYPLPVIDDILPLLSNAKVFTVVDAKNRGFGTFL